MSMHEPTPEDAAVAHELVDWALARLADRRGVLPARPASGPLPPLAPEGIGARAALATLRDAVIPTAIPPDHPRYFAFVPGTATVAATLADMALSAAMIYGGSRLEAGAAVEAEDAVLRWLADAAGFPESAGGTFVSGGSIANLSALVAARGGGEDAHRRRVIVAGASAHSSMAAAAHIMGCELVTAPAADAHGRLDGRVLEMALTGRDRADIVAVVATAGATNTGAFDDLAGVATVCAGHGLWLHVDGAYGGAALLSPRTRPLLDGIEGADSFIVDPHKMLYTPFDCAAVVYRDCTAARRSLTQTADYLDPICDVERGDPSDLAVHLTRRVRGVPLWASVLAYGTGAYAAAVDHCVEMAAYAADADRRDARARARDRAGVHGAPGAPARLVAGRLRRVVRGRAGARRRHAHADQARRRDRPALLLRQSADDPRGRGRGAQRPGGSQPITALTSRKSSSPKRPHSRPLPDCL